MLEEYFLQKPTLLIDFVIPLTIDISAVMGIKNTRFLRSSDFNNASDKAGTERLIDILISVGATRYISGPAARSYLDESALKRENIELQYMAYDYPEYEQLYPPYDPNVSILDLLFMAGPESGQLIWNVDHAT
jgi:hypothetical protein